jgi:homoserine acetyltransferase
MLPMELKIYDAGDVVLQSGLTYRGTRLAYQTYGTLNADRSNAVLFMTPFGAQHTDIEWMVLRAERWTQNAISSSSPTCLATACPRHRATPCLPPMVRAGRTSP